MDKGGEYETTEYVEGVWKLFITDTENSQWCRGHLAETHIKSKPHSKEYAIEEQSNITIVWRVTDGTQ